MSPQLKSQSTFKNSFFIIKNTYNDDDNPKLQPFLSASIMPACPGTVPMTCPSKQLCACSWEVSCLPRGCLLSSVYAMCTLSSNLRQGVRVRNTDSLRYVIWISKSNSCTSGISKCFSHGRLYRHSLSCCATSLAAHLIFIWL